jgi:hypothetical protein
MQTPIEKEDALPVLTAPPGEIQWKFIQDVLKRVERLEQGKELLDEEPKSIPEHWVTHDFGRLLGAAVALVYPGASCGSIYDVRTGAVLTGIAHQSYRHYLLRILDYRTRQLHREGRESITSDYPLEIPAPQKIESAKRLLRSAAEAFLREFDNPVMRIHRHTELCRATRGLRESARVNRNTAFYWAIVEIDDCTRASIPEDMTPGMARALFSCIEQLSPAMTEAEMIALTDQLYDAGFRPWRLHKKRHGRKKTRFIKQE